MRKTIWAVEEGDYSNYHVVGVFSSQENAALVAKAIGGKASVVEWTLDPGVAELHKGYQQFLVWMLRDGTVEHCEARDVSGHALATHAYLWKRTEALAYRGTGTPDVLNVIVWAKDKKHAVKIANEKRVQMIAAGEWS